MSLSGENLNFNNSSAWSFGAGWSWDGYKAKFAASDGSLTQSLTGMTAGSIYPVFFTLADSNMDSQGGYVAVSLGGGTASHRITAEGRHMVYLTAGSSDDKIAFNGVDGGGLGDRMLFR